MQIGQRGFTLSQQLIALSVIGSIAAISAVVLVGNSQKLAAENDTKTAQKLSGDIESTWQLKNVQDGLISRNDIPSDIIFNALKDGQNTLTVNQVPRGCSISLPAKKVTVMDGQWEVIAESNWRRPSNINDRRDLMRYCIRKVDGRLVSTSSLYRQGQNINRTHLLASADLSQSTQNNFSSANTQNDSNLSSTEDSVAISTSVNIDDPVPPTPTWDEEVAIYGSEDGRSVGGQSNQVPWTKLYFSGFYGDQEMKNFLGQNSNGGFTPSVFDKNGDLLFNISLDDLWPNLRFDLTDGRKDITFDERYPEVSIIAAIHNSIYGHNYINLQHPAYMLDLVMGNYLYANYGLEGQKIPDPPVQVRWKNPKTGTIYKLGGAQLSYSPVKINLSGKDAQIDSINKFKLDVDGFKTNSFPVFQTSGGIGVDEAWFLLDRGDAGFSKNDLIDGDDLFGDHMGKYRSGYEDLADAFKPSIHIDASGKRYLDLTPLPWWEQMWINFLRFFGLAKEAIPSLDLKLLKLSGEVIPASDILTRIDLDYKNVEEYDEEKMNAIFQRANVRFKDGTIASSADQWFKPIRFFYATPLDNENKPNSKTQN